MLPRAETARLNGIDTEHYLRDVLARIAHDLPLNFHPGRT
ncbi:transposase domain-containing protein [Acuticoccus sp. MNP-M23]